MIKIFINLLLIYNVNGFILNSVSFTQPSITKIKMITSDVSKSPGEIINLINNIQLGKIDTWSYNELHEHLNTIKSAVIIDNQNVGLFYDKFDSAIHLFKYLPTNINSLIDLITQKGIDYQVYNVSQY